MQNKIVVYFGMLLVVLCWILTPFFRKIPLKNISSFDMFLITQSIVMMYALIILIYLKIFKNYQMLSISNISNKDIAYTLIGGFTTFISSITLIWLLKYNEVTYIMPQLQPVVLVLTILFGVGLFGESVTIIEILGTVLIIVGVFIINKYKQNHT